MLSHEGARRRLIPVGMKIHSRPRFKDFQCKRNLVSLDAKEMEEITWEQQDEVLQARAAQAKELEKEVQPEDVALEDDDIEKMFGGGQVSGGCERMQGGCWGAEGGVWTVIPAGYM